MDALSYLLGKKAGGGGSSGALVPIVVEELPQTGESGKLYLVPRQATETNNVFDEYIYINESWEKIGTAEIDLAGKQDKITSTNKLDASLVDDSLSTNKFTTSAEKIKLNNLNVYFIENNSQENPFILSKHDVGVYHFNPRNNDEVFSVYFKVKESDPNGTIMSTNYYPNSIFVYNNKIEEEQTFSTTILVGKILNMFVNSLRRTISYGSFDVQIQNTGRINFYNKTYTNSLSFLNLEETISAKKTFSVLPESNVVPTTDNQFVNKKYVDDGMAGIDLSSKQDVLTAGDNITIENNVINSSMKSYIITNNSYNNPFIFSEHEIGIYYFKDNASNYYDTGQSNIYVKATKNGTAVNTINFPLGSYILYDTKAIENQQMRIGWIVSPYFKEFNNAKFMVGGGVLTALSNGRISYSNSTGNYEYLDTTHIQTIIGKKTFSVLPESSLTPTTDDQLTNKKYVDDLPKSYTGYDATKTQVLKNINGTLTWVDE